MDPGRYSLQQGWDNNSALDGYSGVHEPDFRAGGSYGSRRYMDEGFSRGSIYARNTFHRDMLERDNFAPPPPYALVRDGRRHAEPFHEMDYRDAEKYREMNFFHDDRFRDNYRNSERENSRDRDYDYGRYSYDSDHERGKRDSSRRREPRDRERRGSSREREQSPYRRHERSRSRGRDDRSRSRSPRGRSRGRSYREDSYEDNHFERSERRRDYNRDDKRYHDSVAPSATVVVKGLSQKTSEEDLYQILAEWGPLRHVRVIKERNSGISRGFAFIDFPDVDAARKMMDGIGDSGLVIDGRKLFFEYSSKPTGGTGGSLGYESSLKSSYGYGRGANAPCDWMCTICGCVNFARRTSCFQCNEPRTDDAPAADVAISNPTSSGKRGSDLGPTHVLVVRGLDENADEEMLRYEFSKHAPIKDLRLVRDKFTHVSRGFAFVHFHSVEDATKALDATNGTTLERNGQVLRVAYAKSIHNPGSGVPYSSSLAAAAIEAATFAQQYDAVGWAPKEYNPDQKQSTSGIAQNGSAEVQNSGSAPQSGFVWDEKSGYYYDAASGFYYDGNTGLYYDGNSGLWYSYDNQTQQYVPCGDQTNSKATGDSGTEASKAADGAANKKVVISAPAATIKSNEKASLPDAVQAAATAALAAEKKEKEKMKEIKLASRSSLLANKKKMNNVLAMWKQRNNEGQAARVVLDDKEPSSATDDKQNTTFSGLSLKSRKETSNSIFSTPSLGRGLDSSVPAQTADADSLPKSRPIMGVIRASGRGVVKSDSSFSGSANVVATVGSATSMGTISAYSGQPTNAPFKTDASALGSYISPMSSGGGKRRFSEAPAQSASKDLPQTIYRDRAAERRSLYGSSSSAAGIDLSDIDSNSDYRYRRGSSSELGAMPFPPGVGGIPAGAETMSNTDNYEVITADRAIDESNVGNRMLRSMGWQEGLGLGKDGSGIKEPVQAKAVDDRSGLGSQQRKTDASLEAQAGDSYRTIIHKKAIARFREMS